MIEDLRIIAKDGGRLSADDCRLIEAAADALETNGRILDQITLKNVQLERQIGDLTDRLAEATRQKPPAPSALAAPAVFDQASYHALASKLCGGYVIAKPEEKPW